MSEAVAPERRKRQRRGGILGFLRDLIIILIVAFVVSFLLKTFLVRSFYIPSQSMEQTLQVNDRILVNQLVPDMVGVQRGDIVVFKDPGGWLHPSSALPPKGFEKVLQAVGLAADTSDEYVVKRVIGVGGDRVSCCDAEGRVMVNGVSLDEPYAVIPEGETRASAIDFDVEVPEGSVWVMGDNRYQSKDSRYNQDQPGKGFVPEEEIVGRAFLLNWPLSHFGWLGTPEGTFTGVEEARSAS
ncbi:signal peptidase I [Leucobacter rhizosphaerae]|uniref:Signal peptidase I n=1 Tax=Leucobacter rhizosphaerae TaxID=2932245 RepID=A0ABY4FWS3_9MICO|nr:signal peptidase I [Leucobacter rhizosphaerae]UOQ60713.1 signal peptidase I [Leucobacter rhizosphaerae]